MRFEYSTSVSLNFATAPESGPKREIPCVICARSVVGRTTICG